MGGGEWALKCGQPGGLCLLSLFHTHHLRMGFPGGSVAKNVPASAGDAGDPGSIPGSGRSPGGVNGNPAQDSCLENPMDRGAWRATVHGVAQSRTRLSDLTHTCAIHIPSSSFIKLELLIDDLVS